MAKVRKKDFQKAVNDRIGDSEIRNLNILYAV